MKQFTTAVLIACTLIGCDSPWDELFSRTPSAHVTLYRAPAAAPDSGVLLAVEAALGSRGLATESHCVRLSTERGTLAATPSTATTNPTPRELALPLSAVLPYRALVVYRQSTSQGATAQPDLVQAELFLATACDKLAGQTPAARAVLALDLSNNQTTGTPSAADMSVVDMAQ